MSAPVSSVLRHLSSPDKQVRLKTLKLLFRHPDATPLQLVQALCSTDNRNGEFLQVFELHAAMRESWTRIRGVTDPSVYMYLAELYRANPKANGSSVLSVLREISTPQALEMVDRMRPWFGVAPPLFEMIRNTILANLTPGRS